MKKAKDEYFQDQIEENKHDSKKLWKNLKGLGLKGKGKSAQETVINVQGELCHDKLKIANEFNNYFTTVADKLACKLPVNTNEFNADSDRIQKFYEEKGISKDSFHFSPVTKKFVLDELNKLKVLKSTGLDMVPARFLKDGARNLYGPLNYIINLSILSSTFPDEMKIAKVTPLHKKKDKTQVGNYRPISVLSVVSKNLEKSVYAQIEKYFQEKKLIYEFQSGFRNGYSTETCLIHLLDFVRNEVSQGRFVGMVLLDLQKAFDTVNHKILLKKLEVMGLDSACIKWFRSYLTNRHQVVTMQKVISDSLPIKCGVPQGSILGPILFMCYINDMCICVKNSKLLLYADDSVLLYSDTNPKLIEEKLSVELSNCIEWMTDNKLSLHVGKTESILFCSKGKLKYTGDFKVTYNNQVIQRKESVKYLGMNLTSDLSWTGLVDSIVKKANARLKFLYRYQTCMNMKSRRILCFALIQCLFDYANAAWYSSLGKMDQKKLRIIQNKIVRFINCLGPRTHVGNNELEKAGVLHIDQRSKQLVLHHVHKIYYSDVDHYITNNFTRVSNVHGHDTRNSKFNFVVPKRKGQIGNSFYFNGIQFWNSLPKYVKTVKNFLHFKRVLKQYLKNESLQEFQY